MQKSRREYYSENLPEGTNNCQPLLFLNKVHVNEKNDEKSFASPKCCFGPSTKFRLIWPMPLQINTVRNVLYCNWNSSKILKDINRNRKNVPRLSFQYLRTQVQLKMRSQPDNINQMIKTSFLTPHIITHKECLGLSYFDQTTSSMITLSGLNGICYSDHITEL